MSRVYNELLMNIIALPGRVSFSKLQTKGTYSSTESCLATCLLHRNSPGYGVDREKDELERCERDPEEKWEDLFLLPSLEGGAQ